MNEFEKLLQNAAYEDNTLEFKKSLNGLPNSFWETYSSFGNTIGGRIILGVTQEKDTYKLVISGVNNPHKIKQDILNLSNDKNKVSENLLTDNEIKIIPVEDKKVIIVDIPEANYDQKPIFINNNMQSTYIRSGEGDMKVSADKLKDLIVASKNDIDNELLTNFDLKDLNLNSVDEYKKILISKNELNKKFESYNHFDFLQSIGVFRKDRVTNEYKLTTGGLIFFGKYVSICDRFPKFQLDYFEKASNLETRWLDRISTGDMAYPEMNMFDFYMLVSKKLYSTTKDKFILNEKQERESIKVDLDQSLREALVNSLMHAYYDADFPIKIESFEDYCTFTNPGRMRISEKEFIHGGNSIMRNSVIPNLFRRMGVSEKAGSGGAVIFDLAEKRHLKTPEIKSDIDKTILTIWKIDLNESFKNLSEDEYLIMKFILEHGSISRKECMDNIGFSEYKYRKLVQKLSDNNKIEKVGKSSSTKYILHKTSNARYYQNKQLLRILDNEITK